MSLKRLVNWAMGKQIRKFKEEVFINAMKEMDLEDELAYEIYQTEQDRKRDGSKDES